MRRHQFPVHKAPEQLLGDLVGTVARGSETSIPWQLPSEAPRSGCFILL